MALPSLPPPPYRSPIAGRHGVLTGDWQRWFQLLYQWLGTSTGSAPLNAANVTGIVPASNLAIGVSINVTADAGAGVGIDPNITNDAEVVATLMVGGETARLRIGRPPSATAAWNVYRAGVVEYANVPSHAFQVLALSTAYFMGYDVVTQAWAISTVYGDIVGDNVIRFFGTTPDPL
jgi:hypothetical protein